MLACMEKKEDLQYDTIKAFLLRVWRTVLSVQEMRAVEMRQQQQDLVSAATGATGVSASFHPQTYEGDDNEMLELVVLLLATVMGLEYDPAISNQLATVFCFSSLASMQFLREYYQTTLPRILTTEQRAATLASALLEVLMGRDLLRVLQDDSGADVKKSCIIMYAIIPLVAATSRFSASLTASFHNAAIDVESAIPTSFLEAYITQYLQSVQARAAGVHKDLLIALLQLNALLIKHLASRISPYRKLFNAFAIHLYSSACDDVVAWSLFFQCQFLVAYQYNGVQIIKLFINIIHLYANRARDVVYRAAALLSARSAALFSSLLAMLQLDSKNKLVLFARVRQNMLMNEHLIEQQIHIWRLIVQNPEFFFPFRAKIVTHILREMRHLGIRSTDAYANRELSVDMLCLITSFEIRDEKEKGASATPVTNTPAPNTATNTPATNTTTNTPVTSTPVTNTPATTATNTLTNTVTNTLATNTPASNGVTDTPTDMTNGIVLPGLEKEGDKAELINQETLRLLAYTQLMNSLCRTVLISCVNPAEQRVCFRGFRLMEVILRRTPRLTLRLDDVDHFTHFYDKLLINYPEGSPSRRFSSLSRPAPSDEKLYCMVMPIIVTFRIAALAIPRFQAEFVEKNAENLQRKIVRTLPYIDHNYIFSAFIELLPGLSLPLFSPTALFSLSPPYQPNTHRLLLAVKDALLALVAADLPKITPQTCQQPTRAWRSLHLLVTIVRQSPGALPQLLSDLMLCCEQVYALYKSLAATPAAQRVLQLRDFDASTSASLSLFTPSTSDTLKIGLPPVPVLNEAEVVHSLLLLLHLLLDSLPRLGEHHPRLLSLLQDLFEHVQQVELLTSVLNWITPWLAREEEVFAPQDVDRLLYATQEARGLQEGVLYVAFIASYWRFLLSLCKRYLPVAGAPLPARQPFYQDAPLQERLRLSLLSGMTLTNPEVRLQYRALYLLTLPASLFARLEGLLSDVRFASSLHRRHASTPTSASGCRSSTRCCSAPWTALTPCASRRG